MEVEVENDTPALEEEIRERILKEREAAEAERIARDKELEEESIQLDKEIEQEKVQMREDGEEVTEVDEDRWYLRRLDGGFYTLQTVDYILAWVCMEDDGVRITTFLFP